MNTSDIKLIIWGVFAGGPGTEGFLEINGWSFRIRRTSLGVDATANNFTALFRFTASACVPSTKAGKKAILAWVTATAAFSNPDKE